MQNIVETNKLINKFIGVYVDKPITDSLALNMGYNSDWNKLMPLVEMIGNLILVGKNDEPISYTVTMYDRICRIECSSITYGRTLLFERHGNTLLEATYSVIVKFIEWYNMNEMKTYEYKKL